MTEPISTPPAQPQAATPQKKGLALTALVLGIVAIVGSWIPFMSIGSILIGFVGLVLGIIAVVKALKGTAAGKVMAFVGTGLSALAIIFGFVSTSAGVSAVDEAIDDLDGEITASTEPATSSQPSADASAGSMTQDSEDAAEAETDEADAVGSFENPGAVGDGTVWTISDGGDVWDVTLDEITMTHGYEGDVAVVLGTAVPSEIAEGATSNWVSFPTIGWMADGASVDDTFDIVKDDSVTDGYRSTVDLEATAGTEMNFYSTVGLPEGTTPDLITLDTLFGGETIYVSTGL